MFRRRRAASNPVSITASHARAKRASNKLL